MSDIAITVDNLGKMYRIGAHEERAANLREAVHRLALTPFRYLASRIRQQSEAETLWALKDISFDIKIGEVLGIIGRNGAGKSTLLKILARITDPTHGRAIIRGRVNALLEVGTGFHEELTGRENVYFSAALHGMSRAEVDRQFDAIVDFAGIDRFVDTPVKRYSSGMRVRLGFSVAAFLLPEVLLVDEVLAVGDLGFQNKCIGKMSEVARAGRTVLYVSHQMSSVSALCSRVVVLENGGLSFDGDVEGGIRRYRQQFFGADDENRPITINQSSFATAAPQRISNLELLSADGQPLEYVGTGDPVCFRLHYEIRETLPNPALRLMVFNEHQVELLRLSTDPISGYHLPAFEPGKGHIDLLFPSFPFTAGQYFITVGILRVKHKPIHDAENAARIFVQPRDVYQSGTAPTTQQGVFVCAHTWRHEPNSTVPSHE